MAYEVIDKRGKDSGKIEEVCRVCGCAEKVHSTVYNEPTMDCIHFLRNCLQATTAEIVRLMNDVGNLAKESEGRQAELDALEKEVMEMRDTWTSQLDEIQYLNSQIETLESRLDNAEVELEAEREKNY